MDSPGSFTEEDVLESESSEDSQAEEEDALDIESSLDAGEESSEDGDGEDSDSEVLESSRDTQDKVKNALSMLEERTLDSLDADGLVPGEELDS